MIEIPPKQVTLDLTKCGGNAFALMASFRRAARKEGWSHDEISKVIAKCLSGNYDHLIATLASRCK